jgi:hypothetical protein
MKYLLKFSFALIISLSVFSFFSCSDDDEQDPVPEPEIVYTEHQVEFYVEHPNVRYNAPVFETVTMQVLVKEASKEGATFETMTTQMLVVEESRTYSLFNEQEFDMVTNVETSTSSRIVCREFFDYIDISLNPTFVPAQYSTFSTERVLVDGTGAVRPAEFRTIEIRRVVSDGEVIEEANPNRDSNIITFRIPETMNIRDYIEAELNALGVTTCIEANGYFVL